MALRTKKNLLEHYSKGEINDFFQYDAFTDPKCFDSVVEPSKDGFAYMKTVSSELFYPMWSVRLFIKPGTKKDVVVKALKGITDWIEAYEGDDCFDSQYIPPKDKRGVSSITSKK